MTELEYAAEDGWTKITLQALALVTTVCTPPDQSQMTHQLPWQDIVVVI